MKNTIRYFYILEILVIVGLLILILKPSVPTARQYVEPSVTPREREWDPMVAEDTLFDLVQKFRLENNLSPYIKSDFLCSIAQTRLQEIQQEFSHKQFIAARFCQNCTLSENLSRGYNSDQLVLDQWLASPSHSEILHRNYTHSCIKIDNIHVVQIFGYY